jgi:hypothetical protein
MGAHRIGFLIRTGKISHEHNTERSRIYEHWCHYLAELASKWGSHGCITCSREFPAIIATQQLYWLRVRDAAKGKVCWNCAGIPGLREACAGVPGISFPPTWEETTASQRKVQEEWEEKVRQQKEDDD